MQKQSAVLIKVFLVGAMLFAGTGCRTKAGGWRWPWQRDRSMEMGGPGTGMLTEPSLIENLDVSRVTDEFGDIVSGARFEDTLQAVHGLNLTPVYFAFDSYALPPSEIAKIESVVQHLQQNNSHVLVIEGHCDERGSNEYNLSLGENRALAVRSYMVNLGISSDRIQSRSYGEEKPAVMGSGEEVWRLNRRGEFALFQR